MRGLLSMAWRNIFRNKRRSFLTLGAVAFACVALLFSMSLQRGKHIDLIQNMVKAQSGHLQIQAEGFWKTHELTRNVQAPRGLLDFLKNRPDVTAYAPQLQAPALISHDRQTIGALIIGIDPGLERQTTSLASVIRSGHFLESTDGDGILLGHLLAKNLGVQLGDEVVFFGQAADGSIAAGKGIVRGICDFGISKLDASLMVVSLPKAQAAFSMGDAVTSITVLLRQDSARPALQRDLEAYFKSIGRNELVVLGWPELLPGVDQLVKLDWVGGLIFYIALVIVVGFGIANTFLIAFFERIREFGVLLALGMKPAWVSALLYAESVFMIFLGVLLGLAAGLPLVFFYQRKGIYISDIGDMTRQYGFKPYLFPHLSVEVFAWALIPTMVVALLFAIYPAWRASKLKAVEALNHR